MLYTITPVYLGSAVVEKSLSIYRRYFGEKLKVCYAVFLLRSDTELIMVDSGPPRPEINDQIPVYLDIDDPVLMTDALAKVGVTPKEITKIILTHLHWDHCYNLELFPQAEIYVQKRELAYAIAPSPGQDTRMFGALPECGMPGWFDGWKQLKRIDGDVEIVSGVKVYLTPGHSPGFQVVLADTKEGKYLMTSDFAPTYENFREGIPNGIHGSLYEWHDSYNRIKDLTPNVLPGHEMGVFDRNIYG